MRILRTSVLGCALVVGVGLSGCGDDSSSNNDNADAATNGSDGGSGNDAAAATGIARGTVRQAGNGDGNGEVPVVDATVSVLDNPEVTVTRKERSSHFRKACSVEDELILEICKYNQQYRPFVILFLVAERINFSFAILSRKPWTGRLVLKMSEACPPDTMSVTDPAEEGWSDSDDCSDGDWGSDTGCWDFFLENASNCILPNPKPEPLCNRELS